jgi:hypothetical protein
MLVSCFIKKNIMTHKRIYVMYTLLGGADTVFFPLLSHRGTIISTGRRSGITEFCGHGTFPKNKFCAQGTFFH